MTQNFWMAVFNRHSGRSNVSENVDIDIDGILKRFDISAQGRATGSSIELVRELAIASGQSVSDTPLESRAIVTEPGKIATVPDKSNAGIPFIQPIEVLFFLCIGNLRKIRDSNF